jgi:16S rRNA (uracil1498-N3)-methyltransferase
LEIATVSNRFHVNSGLAPGLVVVAGPEAHHIKVSRARVGDPICLFNGDGREYRGRVEEITRRDVSVQVTEVEAVSRERPERVIVACPLPKGDRAHFLVEKLTELGVAEMVLLETERSVVHPDESKAEKLERYVIEASKQCGRNVLMAVRGPVEWRKFVSEEGLPATRWLAHPGGGERAGTGARVVAVGPEGGFTDEEVELGRAAGWMVVGMGPRILRVETAAIVLTG